MEREASKDRYEEVKARRVQSFYIFSFTSAAAVGI